GGRPARPPRRTDVSRAAAAARRPRRARPLPPLVLRWGADSPLPRRPVLPPPGAPQRRVGLEAPPYHVSGRPGQPFDFSAAVARLCADVARASPALRHIDTTRLLFDVTQARGAGPHGLQARVTPLRFPGGGLTRRRGKTLYQVQRYVVDGRDM